MGKCSYYSSNRFLLAIFLAYYSRLQNYDYYELAMGAIFGMCFFLFFFFSVRFMFMEFNRHLFAKVLKLTKSLYMNMNSAHFNSSIEIIECRLSLSLCSVAWWNKIYNSLKMHVVSMFMTISDSIVEGRLARFV